VDQTTYRAIGIRNKLAAQRREGLQGALAALAATGRTPHVALYALAETGEDPAHDLAACRAYAQAQGWKVVGEYADTCGRISRPTNRPQWTRVHYDLSRGFADGVVAVNRASITLDDTDYGYVLNSLVRTFLALVPPRDQR
jgi:hypothetical protein